MLYRTRIALALSAAAIAPVAHAQDVAGTTSAMFLDPSPANAVTQGLGSAHFGWGTPFKPVPSQPYQGANELNFIDTPFSANFEQAFKIGTLYYYNGTTLGLLPDTIDVAISLSFSQPQIPVFSNSFTLKLKSTDNKGDDAANADYVYFPQTFSATEFTINGTVYRVQLTGFANIVGDGYLASNAQQLHVVEGKAATADLFARVTTQTPGVPEPGSWAMLIAGFGVTGAAMRHRRKAQVRQTVLA
ncbi:choice-of-anchor K domain-containing protein [Sphingomonas azotifigens]|uniref:choice-of-anchor K domain-containing protein n=1 Tax=Sphingomonas azotifigens TaxID=330920 RepID=UPI001FEB1470|nr:choice-of-anchor K domain-containing protein [Sphingomonas azotifigens]